MRRAFLILVLCAGSARAGLLDARVGPVIEGGQIEFGRSRVVVASGSQLRQLVADGRQVGVIVDGKASYVLPVDDRFSLPVVQRNLARVSSLRLGKGAVPQIEIELVGAAVWFGDLSGEAEVGAAEGTQPLPNWLAETLATRLYRGPEFTVLPQVHGAPSAWAVLVGAKDRWIAVVDPTAGVETLDELRRLNQNLVNSAFANQWLGTEIVAQPLGRNWWDEPSLPWLVTHTTLDIVNSAGEEGVISSRLALQARAGGRRYLAADLQDAVVQRERKVPLEIRSVLVDGKPAQYHSEVSGLLVDLGRTVAAGESIVLEVVTAGPQLQNPDGSSYWWLDPSDWYPRIAGALERGTAQISIDAPADFVPFASGVETTREVRDGRSRLVTKADWPASHLVATAGKFKIFEETRDGFSAKIATYVFGKEREARRLLDNFLVIRPLFEQLTGVPYPFGDLTIVEVDEWGFGQAPAGVIFLSHEAFGTPTDNTARFFSQGANERFLHEIAHMWWGNVVAGVNWEENWLSESFAEYFAALALQAAHGGRAGETAFKRAIKTWKGNASQVKEGASVYLAGRLAVEEYVDAFDRRAMWYSKGPLVLEGLRQELRKRHGAERGDVMFFALLKSFAKNFKFGVAGTRHLVGILDQITGESWQPWFERYVYGTEMPPVES